MEPKIADKKPCVIELEAGTYHWCACGESKSQPFCDGSHGGTGFSPKAFSLDSKQMVALCNCKHSANGHRCDGTHKNL